MVEGVRRETVDQFGTSGSLVLRHIPSFVCAEMEYGRGSMTDKDAIYRPIHVTYSAVGIRLCPGDTYLPKVGITIVPNTPPRPF